MNNPIAFLAAFIEGDETEGDPTRAEAMAALDAIRRELAALRAALEEIRNEQGRVCENYELCEHTACASSYASWAIADKTHAALLPGASQDPHA